MHPVNANNRGMAARLLLPAGKLGSLRQAKCQAQFHWEFSVVFAPLNQGNSIWSIKVSPGLAVIFIISQSESNSSSTSNSVMIAARFADYRRAFARDRAFIHRGNSANNLAVAWNIIASFHYNNIAGTQLIPGNYLIILPIFLG